MENIAGDKMFAHVERALNDRRPITADIFLTNYCNNKCPYCTYRRWELETGAYATMERNVRLAYIASEELAIKAPLNADERLARGILKKK